MHITSIHESIAVMSANIGDCISRVDGLEAREINDRDQELLSNDIEIAGVPEEKEESLSHIVLAVGRNLAVQLEATDIVSAERVGPTRGPADGGAPPKPRPIVVRLTRPVCRDALLNQARVRRGATTADLGVLGPPRKFYINERLTKLNPEILYKAQEAARRLQWRYVWTRGGRVYARKEHGSEKQRLRTVTDINRARPGEGRGGGVGFYVRRGLKVRVRPHPDSALEQLWLELTLPGAGRIAVGTAYRTEAVTMHKKLLQSLTKTWRQCLDGLCRVR
ncbi:hypothetical protein NE865_13354 [Phthorimaea operculella]|nr:hypothetical protein NE865_13354 [Phthorimaea operculella]